MQAATSRLPNPNLATRTLDRREAVRSSQIEGTSSDVDQVLEYEVTGSDDGLPRDVVVNGVVTSQTERKRDRIFIATDVISILNRPPASDQ